MIEDPPTDDEGRKAIKVKIPAKYHVWLHIHKVLEGTNISATVTEALEFYFENEPEIPVAGEEELRNA